jgi:small subunit ribosomal protein S4
MSKIHKFKLYSKLNVNAIDHPKIRFGRLKKQKWLRMKKKVPRRLSEYGSLLYSKQLLKAFYGNLPEYKLITLYKQAKQIKGNTAVNLIKLLERRLDTVLFRLRFGNSFQEVQQLISHNHIMVNGSITSSSSYLLSEGDSITVSEGSFGHINAKIINALNSSLNIKNTDTIPNHKKSATPELLDSNNLLFHPDYLEMNYNTLEGVFVYSPNLTEVRYPFKPDLPSLMQYYEYKLKI